MTKDSLAFDQEPRLRHAVLAIAKAEFVTALRSKQEQFNALLFFVLVIMLFPLGIDPGADFLRPSAGGLLWVAFMLSLMISAGNMFKQDYEDGTVEAWVLSGHPLFVLVLGKVMSLWFVSIVPLLLVSPVLATMLHMPFELMPILLLTLLIGTPALTLVVSIGAALIAGTKGGGVLLMLLILPLATPILIFATGIISAADQGISIAGLIALLCSMLVAALMLCPFATSAALKLSVDQ